MNYNQTITILGGSGFLGSYVVKELAGLGYKIQVVAKHASSAQHLRTCGSVGQIALVDCDITNFSQLERLMKNSDYVINLVGILFPTSKYSFSVMHMELPEKIGKFCKKHDVRKLIHISALGIDASSKTSQYSKSKLAGEKALLAQYPDATILRPSVIFGAEDNFINLFSRLARFSPFLPLIGGGLTKFQPVYVGDIARAISLLISDNSKKFNGTILNLGGSKQYTFKEILQIILETTNRKRVLLTVPFAFAKIKAFFFEFMPKPLLTRDQVENLKYNNTVLGQNGFDLLKIKPTPMESMLKKYF